MAYVEVDLDDFDDEDLIEELKYRGYSISKRQKDSSWNRPSLANDELDEVLWKLREAYILEGGDHFHDSFKKLLAEYGYHV
jgi:hypothetical protein